MQRVALLALSVVTVSAFSGCGKDFKVEKGRVAHVSWDESHGTRVFYGDAADARTFRTLDHAQHARATYGCDDSHVFVLIGNYPVTIDAADPATFTILTADGIYTKDKRVYYWGIEAVGADPDSFRVLEPPYSRDSKAAFFERRKIPVRRIDSFEIVQTPGVYFSPGAR